MAGRKPQTFENTPADGTLPNLANLGEAATALAVAQDQQQTRVRALATQLGYQLPADSVDPDLIQRDISANMRRSVEACLEVGRGLRVLKEACEHGQFMARLEVLGIDKYVASRFMQSAAKFSNLPSNATLKAIGNQTKLFEMLVLDDEQIEELELTGQTGELSLDDVATMSVKELRAKLREAREDLSAKERNMADKNSKIDELTEQLDRTRHQVKKMAPAEVGELTRTKGVEMFGKVETELRALKPALDALRQHSEEHGISHQDFMAGLVGQLQFALNQLIAEYDIKPAADGEIVPAWLQAGAEEEAKAALQHAAQVEG